MMEGCNVCSIIAVKASDDERLITQTDFWRIELDRNQQFLGKIFVTSLSHVPSLSGITDAQWADFASIVAKLETVLKKLYKPSHFNWSCLMNDDAMHDKPTHVHWHLHPRYAEPVSVNGEVFNDTRWLRRAENTDHIVDDTTFSFLTQSIKEAL